jgi:hypothetical protein
MSPDLAIWISDIFPALGYQRIDSTPAGVLAPRKRQAAVMFVPVPPLKSSGKRWRGTGQSALPPAGAGLEINLADAQQRSRLPPELRSALPSRGYVNLAEAKMVVAALDTLITQRRSQPGHSISPPNIRIVATAAFPAQVELMRQLIRRDPGLKDWECFVAIEPPCALRGREFAIVLVSLTRSHTHRAVAYCDHPHTLRLILTRACERLILLGDPGTIVRRRQWEGAVEHLTPAAAREERIIIGRLLDYLEGKGSCPPSFHLGAVASL